MPCLVTSVIMGGKKLYITHVLQMVKHKRRNNLCKFKFEIKK